MAATSRKLPSPWWQQDTAHHGRRRSGGRGPRGRACAPDTARGRPPAPSPSRRTDRDDAVPAHQVVTARPAVTLPRLRSSDVVAWTARHREPIARAAVLADSGERQRIAAAGTPLLRALAYRKTGPREDRWSAPPGVARAPVTNAQASAAVPGPADLVLAVGQEFIDRLLHPAVTAGLHREHGILRRRRSTPRLFVRIL